MSWRDVEALIKLIDELGWEGLNARAIAEHLVKKGVVAPNEDLAPIAAEVDQALKHATPDQLRAEVRRRGQEIHSKQFSQAAQQALRELEQLRRRIDELVAGLRPPRESEPPLSRPKQRRFAKPDEEV